MLQKEEIPKHTPEQRLEIIKRELPRGTNQDEIATMCGVCRATINRDIRAWELGGGFEDWLRREFKSLSEELIEQDKPLVYREISKLTARTMTTRTESKVEGFGQLVIWRPDHPQEEPEPEGEGDDRKT